MVGTSAFPAQCLPNCNREAILSLILSSTTLCTALKYSLDVFLIGKLNDVTVIEGA